MTLHHNRELFSEVVIQTAQMMGLPEIYIEKDYWVTYSSKGSLRARTEIERSSRVVHHSPKPTSL